MSLSERDKSGGDRRVITRALLEARRRGLDDPSQIRYAVAAVLSVRPDMSAIDATRSVENLALRNGHKHA